MINAALNFSTKVPLIKEAHKFVSLVVWGVDGV